MQRYKKNITSQILQIENNTNLLSHLGFLIVIGLSAGFHELRNTFGESAMILFNFINEPNLFSGSTWFSVNWFQNIATILAVKCGLSFSLVSIVFSASPMIFIYVVFLITNYVFKQKNSGIFLLLLLLGVNQTFFMAVHTPLIATATFYLIFVCCKAIWKTHYAKYFPVFEIGTWAIICLFISVISVFQISPNAYKDVVEGSCYFSFFSYFSSVAISTFVISFVIATYLVLIWIHRKQYKRLAFFVYWSLTIFLAIAKQSSLLGVSYELLYFPLIAWIIGVFMIEFGTELASSTKLNQTQQSATRFWVVWALVILSVFGQLRTFQDFEKRQKHLVKLLQHTPKNADKFALSEHLQQLERYIDPTFLAFETPLIAKFQRLPVQSVFFIPIDSTKNIPSITTNSPYFNFATSHYIISDTAFIKRILRDTIRDTTGIVFTGDSIQYASSVSLWLHRGDSIHISVLRKGSNNGHLIMSDHLPINTKFWTNEQYISEPDSAGWQRLSIVHIVSETDRYKAYVWNRNYKNEQIYFKDFRIEIWRE